VRGDRLDSDAAALRALYVSRGFEKADIDIPKVDLDETGKRATVTFSLTEGPRISIRRTSFEGVSGIPEDQLRAAAGLTEGVPFTREAAATAATRIRRVYDGSGWPDARILWRAEKAGGDEEAEEDDIIFTVEEGRRQSIDQVEITGNVLTDDNTIRRQLTVLPHESLSRVDLLASQTRLYRLGVFRSVELRPVPLPKPPAASPAAAPPAAVPPAAAPPAAEAAPPMPISSPASETLPPPSAPPPAATQPAAQSPEPMPAPAPAPGPSQAGPPAEPQPRSVEITVREAPSLRQSFGIGYDSSEKIRGLYEIAERNLFGSARYLGLQLRASSLEERASILYREQGIWSGRYDLTGSAYGIDEDRPSFTGRTVGIAAQLGRDLGKSTRLRYRYTLKDVNPTDESNTLESGSTIRLASLSASGVHDSRDVPFGPTRGHFYAIDLYGYGRAIGSEAQFAKIFLQAFTFKEILPRTVWAQAVRAGAAITFGLSHSDPASTGDDLSGVPQTERFFAGGDTTLRGFRLDLAGPLDANGDPLGGEGLFLLNEELRFPIWSHFQGVIFADVGNVYRTLGDYTLRDLRECAGAGLRLMTPIGPFRMEYGALLDRRPGEEPGQFFISIGQAF
jgi:outer membrane protein assembly factor BamA